MSTHKEVHGADFPPLPRIISKKELLRIVPYCDQHILRLEKKGNRMARDLRAFASGNLHWNKIAPGCVLYGPPGTGKTTFGRALAATCGLPLVETTFGEWQGSGEGHLGSLIKAMSDVFALARAVKPCILFIDELDSIPSRGSGRHNDGYWMAVTNELLKALDKIGKAEGVVVIGACNHPDKLDPAVVRSGRMDAKIKIDLPDVAAIAKILGFHLTLSERLSLLIETKREDLSEIAKHCVGMSGADIARLVREAGASARAHDRYITVADVMIVLDPPARRMKPEDRRRLAVHEAGYGVATYRLGLAPEITLSIAARDSSAHGRVHIDPRTVTRDRIDRHITALLAGRAAEEIFCGAVSGGAGGGEDSPLGQATRLAIDAVTTLGLSRRNPLGWYAGGKGADRNHYSPSPFARVTARSPHLVEGIRFADIRDTDTRGIRRASCRGDGAPSPRTLRSAGGERCRANTIVRRHSRKGQARSAAQRRRTCAITGSRFASRRKSTSCSSTKRNVRA